MPTRIQEMKWRLHNYKKRKLYLWGLKKGYMAPYDEELIHKLRTIYSGGIPASILLLSNGMSNGHCYDRALLLARAFIVEDEVQLIDASVDSLRLNPQFIKEDDPLYADHCIVERTTKDGHHLIYDTSAGFVFDKELYWKIEHPRIRKINKKDSIKAYMDFLDEDSPEDLDRDKYVTTLILPMLEMSYERPTEMYANPRFNLLKREIEHYKELIHYDELYQEVEEDMKRVGLKK